MTLTVRIYETEERAQDAVAKLTDFGFRPKTINLLSPMSGNEAESVERAIREGFLPTAYRGGCTQALRDGNSIVSIEPEIGYTYDAIEILDSCGPTDVALPQLPRRPDPAPFSSALGIPPLWHTRPLTELPRSDLSFSDAILGMPLLSKNPAPLSSLFGMKTLSTPKRSWTSSFGLPLLSTKAAPFSSMFGIKTLSAPKRSWSSSFGLPLLSKHPAPMSAFFGLPVLTRPKRR